MDYSKSDHKRPRRVIAGFIVPALLFLGCGDDADTAEVTPDNVLALGIAAAQTADRGAVTAFLLVQLGYVLPAGPGGESGAAEAPSLGVVLPPMDDLCLGGSSTTETVSGGGSAQLTTLYEACALDAFPCLVDGVAESSISRDGLEAWADGLSVQCEALPNRELTDEDTSCDLDGCEVDIKPFDAILGDATVTPKSLTLGETFVEEIGTFDAEGSASLSGEGRFDFETVEPITRGCPDDLPLGGVIAVYGSGDAWGTIEFADEMCNLVGLCFAPDAETALDCEEVAVPSPMPI